MNRVSFNFFDFILLSHGDTNKIKEKGYIVPLNIIFDDSDLLLELIPPPPNSGNCEKTALRRNMKILVTEHIMTEKVAGKIIDTLFIPISTMKLLTERLQNTWNKSIDINCFSKINF